MGKEETFTRGRRGPTADKERRPRQSFDKERRPRPGQSLSEEIMALDTELLKIMARRAALVNKLRKGKAHAASPGIIKSEREIRGAWERQAGPLAGGTRLSRQLFGLIHELDIRGDQAVEGYSPFNMSPRRQPVDVDIAGPACCAIAQLWMALAVSSGRPSRLLGIPPSSPVLSTVRAFEQTGVHIAWEGDSLVLDGKNFPDFYSKTIFVGDDLLTLCLLIFLGLANPGKMRFAGGPELKEADLGVLLRFLPSLGARLAPVIPGARGLPANLECSGVLPDEIVLQEELPDEVVMALLLAALTWKRQIRISLSALAPNRQQRILGLARRGLLLMPDLGQVLKNDVIYTGYSISDLDFPAEFQVPLDPELCVSALALPIFAGGRVKLSGKWPDLAQAKELLDLLAVFGLEIKVDAMRVSGSLNPESVWPESLEMEELSARYHPLFWVLNARLAYRAKKPIGVRRWPAGADLQLAEDFLAQVGLCLERDENLLRISPMPAPEYKEVAAKTYGWPCPGFGWGVALALGAFMRSNLKIGNPECLTGLLPNFWNFYNGLPSPAMRAVATEAAQEGALGARSGRRRIRTDVTVEPEAREEPTEQD